MGKHEKDRSILSSSSFPPHLVSYLILKIIFKLNKWYD